MSGWVGGLHGLAKELALGWKRSRKNFQRAGMVSQLEAVHQARKWKTKVFQKKKGGPSRTTVCPPSLAKTVSEGGCIRQTKVRESKTCTNSTLPWLRFQES